MVKYLFAATFCLAVTVARAQTNSAVTPGNGLREKNPSSIVLQTIQLRGTTPTMFATLVREAGLAGGVALPNEGCSQGTEGSISVPAGMSLNVALEQVAKTRAMSKWQLQDGVLNLLLAGGPPPLLQVRIPRFEWDGGAPVGEAIDRLRQLPEVSQQAVKLGLREAPIEGGTSAVCIRGDCGQKQRRAALPEMEENATLLAVLNQVVHAHAGAVWIYSEYHCDKGRLFSLEVSAE
jgi:hypothetical protein